MNPNPMRYFSPSRALMAGFFSLCAAVASAAEPLTVAIFDFATATASPAAEAGGMFGGAGAPAAAKRDPGAEIAILLNAKLAAVETLVLVERAELAKILGEQELGLSGTVQPDTVAKVGQLTGAKVLVTGRAFEAGGKHYAVAKIISTETGRVFGQSVTYADDSGLDKAVGELAEQIAATLKKQSGVSVATVEDGAAQNKRLMALTQGKTLPSVSVSIQEQHLTAAVIDPAAETELRLMLAQLGFRVIDTKESTEVPAIAITGEAFSEVAVRRGNLVSCRARVELKVVQTSTKALLLSERQADVAIDVAEHVAAKEALARAARKLADRVVPKLIVQ